MLARTKLFSAKWVSKARASSPDDSWARKVVDSWCRGGKRYLATLRGWLSAYSLADAKEKARLVARLESFDDKVHVAAVNELTFWKLLLHRGMEVRPLPVAKKKSRPDFEIVSPSKFYAEVSTNFQSDRDCQAFGVGEGVELDQRENCRRLLGKVTTEKKKQVAYAAQHGAPSALAIFDYSTWSSFGTEINRALGEVLDGVDGFQSLPRELSAIMYLERGVLNGRIVVRPKSSAIFRNPFATHPLPAGMLECLGRQKEVIVLSRCTCQSRDGCGA